MNSREKSRWKLEGAKRMLENLRRAGSSPSAIRDGERRVARLSGQRLPPRIREAPTLPSASDLHRDLKELRRKTKDEKERAIIERRLAVLRPFAVKQRRKELGAKAREREWFRQKNAEIERVGGLDAYFRGKR